MRVKTLLICVSSVAQLLGHGVALPTAMSLTHITSADSNIPVFVLTQTGTEEDGDHYAPGRKHVHKRDPEPKRSYNSDEPGNYGQHETDFKTPRQRLDELQVTIDTSKNPTEVQAARTMQRVLTWGDHLSEHLTSGKGTPTPKSVRDAWDTMADDMPRTPDGKLFTSTIKPYLDKLEKSHGHPLVNLMRERGVGLPYDGPVII